MTEVVRITAPGARGPRGVPGPSAYDTAVENGFVGTEPEWLASLGTGGFTLDSDGTLILNGVTLEVATDTQLAAEATARAAADASETAARIAADAAEATARANADTAETAARIAADAAKADLVAGTVPDAQIHASIARDTEVAAAVAAEAAARSSAISAAVNGLVNSAPGLLDTLGEIAAQLQADETGAAALATTVAGKQPLDNDLSTIAALDSTVAGALVTDGSGWFRKTYTQLKTALALTKADVGLGSVDDTSDALKPVSVATQTALDLKLSIANAATNYQPLDPDLSTLAALDSSASGIVSSDGAGWFRKTYAQVKTALVLVKGDVGLGNVDNTSDTAKPVSTAQQTALDLKATLASPALTGVPTAPTAAQGTNTTQLATTAFTRAEIAALINSAPGALDTLGELATALTADEATAATLATLVGTKAPLVSPALTGSPTAPTQAASDNSTKIATTAYVDTVSGLLVPKSLVTTKGDLLVASASGTIVRKGVGSDGQVLTADAASAGGVKWAAAGGSTQGVVQFMQSGRYYTTVALGTLSGIGQGPGECRLVPIWVDTAITVAEISIEVTTLGASSFQRLGIYGTTNGLPGTLILDAGQVSAATTGVKTITVSQALSPGLYWLAQACQGAINYVQMAAGGATLTPGVAGTSLSTSAAYAAYRSDTITGAFPGTFTVTSVAVQAPRIWIKVA